jgi:copper chaperone CopZ
MSSENTIVEDLTVQGMSCRHCIDAVAGALGRLDGVTVHDVQIGQARISYPSRMMTEDRLAAALEEAGFSLEGSQQVS